jgi:hypothetical protein
MGLNRKCIRLLVWQPQLHLVAAFLQCRHPHGCLAEPVNECWLM